MNRKLADVLNEAKQKGFTVTIWYVAGRGSDHSVEKDVSEVGVDFLSTTDNVYIPFTAISRLSFGKKEG